MAKRKKNTSKERIEYEDNRKPVWEDDQLKFKMRGERKRRVLAWFSHRVEDARKVLDAFQAAGWPHWIPNPLPDHERPWKTIGREIASSLNKSINRTCIEFKADAEGMAWRILDD